MSDIEIIRDHVRYLAREAPRRERGALFPGLVGEARQRVMRYMDAGAGRDPSTATLDAVFSAGHTFGSFHKDVGELSREIRDGAVSVQIVRPEPVPWSLLESDELSSLCDRLFSGRSMTHKHLCCEAALWLDSTGVPWRTYPLDYTGGIADVAAEDGSVFVECGYTQALKVLRTLVSAQSPAVAVFPYSETTGAAGTPGWVFRWVRETAWSRDADKIENDAGFGLA